MGWEIFHTGPKVVFGRERMAMGIIPRAGRGISRDMSIVIE